MNWIRTGAVYDSGGTPTYLQIAESVCNGVDSMIDQIEHIASSSVEPL